MADASSGGIDRRRVLAGIAWTTPAIVLAVGVPQAAASGENAAGLTLVDAGGNVTTDTLTLGAAITYVAPANPQAPVTNLTATFVIPNGQVSTATAPVPAGTFWTAAGAPVVGATDTTFTFVYSGSDLTSGSPTAQIAVQFARTGNVVPFNATIRANGESATVPVEASQVVPIGVGATIVFNVTPPTQAQSNYLGQGPANVFFGTTRWAGPYYPVGVAVAGVACIAKIPVENGTGRLFEGTIGAGWTRTVGPSEVDGYWYVRYDYGPAISSSNQNTTELQFGLERKPDPLPSPNSAVLRTQGEAQTSPRTTPVFVQVTPSPVPLTVPVWTPYPEGPDVPEPPAVPFEPYVGPGVVIDPIP